MTLKQTIFSILFFTIANNNIFAMNNDDNMLARPSGYWTPKSENYLTTPTHSDHQREDWYTVTKYVAEPWSTISNAGFFITANAIKKAHPLSAAVVAFAGSASAISHAIPYHSFNVLDRIGAWTAMATVAYESKLYKMATISAILNNPVKLSSLLLTGATVLTDHYIAHSQNFIEQSNGWIPPTLIIKRKSEHKWIHVLWHILAAWTAYALLTTNLS